MAQIIESTADDDEGKESRPHRALYDALEAKGLLEYGSFIHGDLVRAVLGIEMPQVGSRADFAAIALLELSAIDGVREILLNVGKYIAGSGDGYRILTPGENAIQVDRYLSHAANKIRRARKLARTTPAMTSDRPDQTGARLLLLAKSIRKPPQAP